MNVIERSVKFAEDFVAELTNLDEVQVVKAKASVANAWLMENWTPNSDLVDHVKGYWVENNSKAVKNILFNLVSEE